MPGCREEKGRFREWLVLCCVAGMLLSFAVPGYLRHRREEDLSRVLRAADWHSRELARWWEEGGAAPAQSGSPVQGNRQESQMRRVDDGAIDIAAKLREYVDYFGAVGAESGGADVPLIVERVSAPDTCRRDGRVHLVPAKDEHGQIRGAWIVATNRSHSGGPRNDGILVMHRVGGEIGRLPAGESQGK